MAGLLPAGDADEASGEAVGPRQHFQPHPHHALAQRRGGGVALQPRSISCKDLLGAILPGKKVSILWPCEVN